MTSDKQTNKPFTPSLSAAFSRTNKNPLTPKLASSANHHTPRRPPHADSPSPNPSRDDASSTLAPTYLSANVTPRSGPRISRRDGAVSPPASVYSSAQEGQRPSRPMSMVSPAPGYRAERSPARSSGREPARLARAKSVAVDNFNPATSRPGSSCGSSAGSPMFFHADDARSSASSFEQDNTRPRSYVRSTPSSPFVYANGQKERPPPSDDSRSSLSVTKRRSTGPSRPAAPAKPPAALSPRVKSPQLPDAESRTPEPHVQSPSRMDGPDDAALQSTPPHNAVRRRPSLVGRRPSGHVKSCSVDSTHHIAGLRELRANPTIPQPLLSPDLVAAGGETTPEQQSPRIVSNGSAGSAEPYPSFPLVHSPIRAEGNHRHSNDQAANARTARKVLDLEISNSSLLAINRTLEREMRKQNAELRRYRRLTRAGRLSLATPPQPASKGLDAVSEGGDLNDGDEADDADDVDDSSDESDPEKEEEEEEEELTESGDEDSVDEGTLSPSALAERDARQRERDEKRFQLDLTKHQKLLINHQKMNQSIKRCLGWTEELIREGRRALEYSVHANDVELGGRVLAPDEMSEVGESGRGLLSQAAEIPSDLQPTY